MRAILVHDSNIEVIDLNDTPEEINRLLRSRCYTLGGYPDDDHICYVDDEGLLSLSPGTYIRTVAWHPEPLAGNLLITGIDDEGRTTPATLTPSQVINAITTTQTVR